MDFLNYVEQSYQTIDFKNYLVMEQKAELTPVKYCCKMLERNQIPGFLPMYRREMDNKTSFYYDISGKLRLVDFLERNEFTQEQGRNILLNLAESLKTMSKYFFKQEFCILDLQYVFINDAKHIFYPILPIEELMGRSVNVAPFFQTLVSRYFVTDEDNPFYDGLLKYLVRQEFDLDEFIRRVRPEVNHNVTVSGANDIGIRQENIPEVKQPDPFEAEVPSQYMAQAPVMQEMPSAPSIPDIPESNPAGNPNNGILIPGGVAIPGVPTNQGIPQKEEPKKGLFGGKKEKKEKKPKANKEKKEFHLFGGKKKAEVVPEAVPEQMNNGAGVPFVNAPQGVQYNQNSMEQLNQIPATAQPTVITNNAADDATVLLDGDMLGSSSVYLMHQNVRIAVTKTPFVIGKLNADYTIEKGYISRVHATILQQDGIYYIQDENSKNHTYINGVQLAPYTKAVLENGTRIKLGIEELVFYTR